MHDFVANIPYKIRFVPANELCDATDVLKVEAFAIEANHLDLEDSEKLTITAGYT